jgi:hypothetical protein
MPARLLHAPPVRPDPPQGYQDLLRDHAGARTVIPAPTGKPMAILPRRTSPLLLDRMELHSAPTAMGSGQGTESPRHQPGASITATRKSQRQRASLPASSGKQLLPARTSASTHAHRAETVNLRSLPAPRQETASVLALRRGQIKGRKSADDRGR